MAVAKDQELADLLDLGESEPYEIVNEGSRTPIVLACDHSSNRVPGVLGDLGLAKENLEQHIAWDIGAGAVARQLSAKLDATAVLGTYSRLVVDLNRDLRDLTAFPAISDGVLIPGNISLSVEERAERARVFFKPYHEVLRSVIQERSSPSEQPVLISIHSFTPRQFGVLRPWHVGILWDEDPRLAVRLLAALRDEPDIIVGDNEPYSGRHPADYTIDHHAEPLGLSYAAIELRQDKIEDESGQREWADRLARIFNVLLQDKSLFLRPTD